MVPVSRSTPRWIFRQPRRFGGFLRAPHVDREAAAVDEEMYRLALCYRRERPLAKPAESPRDRRVIRNRKLDVGEREQRLEETLGLPER